MIRRESLRLGFVLVLAALFLGVPAYAQEQTGSVSGTVMDADGGAIPGTSVTITGPSFSKTVVTNAKGFYRIPALQPGTYSVAAELDGFQKAEYTKVRISLGGRLELDFTIHPDTVKEVIEVTAEAPIISLRASDTSAVISKEWVEKLPTGRDFTDVVSQVAGANDEDDLLGGISIDGASGAENRFIVDGMDTTNLQEGTSEKTLITDFLEEVQVKASGYTAEFGGSTGGVISAVTKSGSNQFKGEVHGYYEDSGLPFDERDVNTGDGRPETLQLSPTTGEAEYAVFDEDDFTRTEPGFSLGGPIYKDKVWFFLGYSPATWDVTRVVDYGGGEVNTFERTTDFDYGTANISASFGSLFVKLSGNISDSFRDNTLPSRNGTGSSDPADYNVDRDQPNRSYSLNTDWLASYNTSLNLRAGHFEYDTRDTGFYTGIWYGFSTLSGIPTDLFPDFPAELNVPLGSVSPTNSGTAFDFFERDFVTGDVTYYTDGFGGEHEIKVGGLWEEIGNEVLTGYTNTRLLFYWGRTRVDLTGEPRTGPYGHYRVLQIATQGQVSAQNSALYVQDSWRPNSRLTVNLGLRAEKERIPSFAASSNIPPTAIGFDYDDKIAPRLGFAYDMKGDGRWKLYGSYGIFYDNTKLEMPRGSFGADKWVDWFFGLDTFDWPSIVANCQIQENSIEAGPPPGCPGEFLFAADRRHPSNDPEDSTIDPNLKPMESNEITIGVEHMLSPKIAIGARYVHKELERTIEDVGVLDPAIGEVFFIANPGEGVATDILGPNFPSQPAAEREYDGLTLTFRKNFSNSWGLNASYTYSRLYGNYSGLASSDEDGRLSPNVNRFFDGLQSSFDANGNAVYGRLASDRPHQFKMQFIYETPWGSIVGLDQRIASGTPVTTEYDVAPGLPFFPYGRGDQGRTPTLTQTDLYLAHEFPVGADKGLEVSLSIFNLFDEDTAIDIYNSGVLSDLPLSEEEFFSGFNPEQVIDGENVPRDPRFGLAEEFQRARSVRLGIHFRFD